MIKISVCGFSNIECVFLYSYITIKLKLKIALVFVSRYSIENRLPILGVASNNRKFSRCKMGVTTNGTTGMYSLRCL